MSEDAIFQAPLLRKQSVSVTRQMAAALGRLTARAAREGRRLHHLGAGYPHPEVSEPSAYIAQKRAYFSHLARNAGEEAPELRSLLTRLYGYGDTLGPPEARQAFARVYGHDFGFDIDPDDIIPTVGATGGIALLCSLFERSGARVAYLVDAPTYTGLLSRAVLYQGAAFYSVEMDDEGPLPEVLAAQADQARQDGCFVAFYYTIPDGHNPGGISFSQRRRERILEIARDKGLLVVEDAPYTYISYEEPDKRPQPLVAMDPQRVVHLFTASKIGLPGPRVGMALAAGQVALEGGQVVPLRDLLLTESSGSILLHSPEALRGFEAYLHDEQLRPRASLWPIAARKNAVYGQNRQILLDGLDRWLGPWPELFSWTRPGAGFFSVFTFRQQQVRTDQAFIERLVTEHGVVTIPMYGFYPQDARERDPWVGLDQVRLAFSYSPRMGQGRVSDMEDAVRAFCHAVRVMSGLAGLE